MCVMYILNKILELFCLNWLPQKAAYFGSQKLAASVLSEKEKCPRT